MRKQIIGVQINMNIDTERLKERMIILINERYKLYIIPLLDDLEMPYTNIHLTMDMKHGTMQAAMTGIIKGVIDD